MAGVGVRELLGVAVPAVPLWEVTLPPGGLGHHAQLVAEGREKTILDLLWS